MEGVVLCSGNYIPLSPISFLERAGSVYGDRDTMVYGAWKTSWRETHERCIKLASALVHYLGISPGDIVSLPSCTDHMIISFFINYLDFGSILLLSEDGCIFICIYNSLILENKKRKKENGL